MNKLYHLCVSSPEVMFRVPADYIQGINRACLAAHDHDVKLWAYAFMSNHFHLIAQVRDPVPFISSLRNGYSKWFNNKYSRSGPLGYRSFFCIELDNGERTIEVVTYVLRNAVNHNVAVYPTGYPFCSARYYFIRDFGYQNLYTPLETWFEKRQFISRKEKLPEGYVLDKSGLLIQENILQIKKVEQIYGNPRKFSFYMNKLSGEEWAVMQVESWMGAKAKELLGSEKFLKNINRINDIDICEYIDEWLLKNKNVASYTALSINEKIRLAAQFRRRGIANDQISRCLVISEDILMSSVGSSRI